MSNQVLNIDFSSINNATFNVVPVQTVQACCVFAKSFDEKTVTLFCPDEADFEMVHGQTLNFALDKKVRLIPVPRKILEAAIAERFTLIREMECKAEKNQVRFLIASVCLFLISLGLPSWSGAKAWFGATATLKA